MFIYAGIYIGSQRSEYAIYALERIGGDVKPGEADTGQLRVDSRCLSIFPAGSRECFERC